MGVDSNEFPLPENWLPGINHNKNGTSGLSSLKDQLPWDIAETSPIICPSEAETMEKNTERIPEPEGTIFKQDKNTVQYCNVTAFFLYFIIHVTISFIL